MKTLIVLLLIAVALVFGVQTGAGYVAATAIEQMGSRAVGGTVTVDSVSVSVIDGTVDISGLAMTGMKGFGDSDAVEVKDISLTVDRESLGGDTVSLTNLVMDGPAVTYAVPASGADLQRLISQAQRQGGSFGSGNLPGGNAGPAVSIGNLQVSSGTVNLNVGGQVVSVPMPDIQAQNIGGSDGASIMTVVQQVMGQVMASSAQALASMDPEALAKGAAGGSMSGQMDAARKAMESMGGEAAKGLQQLMNQQGAPADQ